MKSTDINDATVNQPVVQATIKKTDRIIASESALVLSRRESLGLLELIENPPPCNQKFRDAKARYERMKSGAHPSSE